MSNLHIHQENETLTAQDNDELLLDRPGSPLTTWKIKFTNLVKNFASLFLSSNAVKKTIKFPEYYGVEFMTGNDHSVAGLALGAGGATNGAWTTVGPVRRMTIATTKASATALYLFCAQSVIDNETGKQPWLQSVNPGLSFTIETDDLAEQRNFGWLLIETYTS